VRRSVEVGCYTLRGEQCMGRKCEENSVWAGNVRRSVEECYTLRGEQYVSRKCEEVG
jgi:hypothetical protein